MKKSIKKIFITSASLLLMASVGAGINNLSTNNVHASRVYLDQYASSWEKRDGITHWRVSPKRGTYFKHGIPRVRYCTKTFYKNGHSFIVKAVFGGPGEIIGMDGTTHVSSTKVRRALAFHHYLHHARREHRAKHYRRRKMSSYKKFYIAGYYDAKKHYVDSLLGDTHKLEHLNNSPLHHIKAYQNGWDQALNDGYTLNDNFGS